MKAATQRAAAGDVGALQLAFFDERLRPLTTRSTALAPVRSAKTRRRIEERVCCACSVTWDALVADPATTWRSVGSLSMVRCSRCSRYVCYACDARYRHEHLCPTCFALPAPTAADVGAHPLVLAQHPQQREAEIERLRARFSWPHAEPSGQHNEIVPTHGWYWQNHASISAGVSEKESTRRLRVAYGMKPALPGDEAWLPPEIASCAAAFYARQATGDDDDGE